MTFFEDAESKLKDLWKRHTTAIVVLIIAIAGIWIFTALQSDKQEQLTKIYTEMQHKQDAITNAIDAKFAGQNIPVELVTAAKHEAVTLLTLTPEYQVLEKQARILEVKEGEYSPFKALLIAISGLMTAGIITQILLYIMTSIPFTKLIMKGEDSKYSEGEQKSATWVLIIVFAGAVYLITEVIKTILK